MLIASDHLSCNVLQKKQEFDWISNMLILLSYWRLSEISSLWIKGLSHPFLFNFGPQKSKPQFTANLDLLQNPQLIGVLLYITDDPKEFYNLTIASPVEVYLENSFVITHLKGPVNN